MASSRLLAVGVVAAALLATCDAFTAPALLPLRAGPHASAAHGRPHSALAATPPPLRRRAALALAMSTAEKESPLEGGGERGLEEEERRIGMWRGKFELDDAQISVLRTQFDVALTKSSGELRTIDKTALKSIIQTVSSKLDTADISKEGRPVISEEELGNYIDALKGLWEESCGEDAVELANGECGLPLDTKDFDLSEVVAVYGMCVRDHCGIGGVCFWDSE